MKNILRLMLAALTALCVTAVGRAQQPNLQHQTVLEQVAFVHGGTGPFAVAGYRIGERALQELKLPRGSFSLEVVHRTPNEVQWSCIADGVQAATGVSVGKLNLKIEPATPDSVETIVRDKKSGRAIVFRLAPSFTKRYLDLPHEKLTEAGKEVLMLPDEQIFSMKTE